MVEVLQFALSSPTNFLGTLALIMITGIAGEMILSPFGRPRNITFLDAEEEDGDQD